MKLVPPRKTNFELAKELEDLLQTVPVVESQRELIKVAAERLRYTDDD